MATRIRLSWVDANSIESGHHIYRSITPMDPGFLPEPYATVGAGVTEYLDTEILPDTRYYYRVSAYNPFSEEVSDEVSAGVNEMPEILSITPKTYLAATTAHYVELPTTRNVGDLIVVLGAIRTTENIAVPAGWTTNYITNTTGGLQSKLIYKVLDGSEPNNFLLTTATGCVSSFKAYRIKAGTFDSRVTSTGITAASILFGSSSVTSSTSMSSSGPRHYWEPRSTLHIVGGAFSRGTGAIDVTTYGYPDNNAEVDLAATSGLLKVDMSAALDVPVIPETTSIVLSASSSGAGHQVAIRGNFAPSEAEVRIGAAAIGSSSVSSFTMAIPAVAQPGDTLILVTSSRNATPSLPTDWTSLLANNEVRVASCLMTSEMVGTNITVNLGVAGNFIAHIFIVAAGSTDGQLAVSALASGTGTTVSTAAFDAGSGFTGSKNSVLCMMYHDTTPSSSTTVYPQVRSRVYSMNAASGGLAYAYCHGALTGKDVPAQTFTVADSAAWKAVTILIKGPVA